MGKTGATPIVVSLARPILTVADRPIQKVAARAGRGGDVHRD
jgi:hypothetical protein